jgi:LysM repeat protein
MTSASTPSETASDSIEYIVVPGDTLLAISKRFGIDLVTLMNANSITDARLLHAGQTLRIPGVRSVPAPAAPPASAAMPPALQGKTYIVRVGDTFSSIATRFHVTVQSLLVANNIYTASELQPGQQLTIPDPSGVMRAAETEALNSTPPQGGVLGIGDAATPTVSADEIRAYLAGKRTTYYVTRPGETLAQVASLFSVNELILAQINQTTTGAALAPGTRLLIPMP